MSHSTSPSPKTLELADKVGQFIEYWGFKQVHGRIWALLFLSKSPLDANYLIDSLKISKALVSMSLKDLIHYKVILEVEKEKPGTQKYSVNPQIADVILDVLMNRELVMLEEIQKCFQGLEEQQDKKTDETIDPERMAELGEMVQMAHFILKAFSDGSKVDFKLFDETLNLPK